MILRGTPASTLRAARQMLNAWLSMLNRIGRSATKPVFYLISHLQNIPRFLLKFKAMMEVFNRANLPLKPL
jgi:hypothetical protein